MTRNRRKMIEKMADFLLLSKHSIQFSALFLLLSDSFMLKLIRFENFSLQQKWFQTMYKNEDPAARTKAQRQKQKTGLDFVSLPEIRKNITSNYKHPGQIRIGK